MMVLFLVILAFAVGVALVMGGYIAFTKMPVLMQQRQLDQRLQELSAPPEAGEKETEGADQGPARRADAGVRSRSSATTTRGSAIGRWIEQSGVKASMSGLFLVAVRCWRCCWR